MWIINGLGFVLLPLFFYLVLYSSMASTIKDKEKREKILKRMKKIALCIFGVIFGILIIFQLAGFRIDYEAGQHFIIPTAIDTDFWGNYKVYYKTTPYETNSSEEYYMVESKRTDLIEDIKNCIREKEEIIVYYDRWVGFKGITSPISAPITGIEKLNDNF